MIKLAKQITIFCAFCVVICLIFTVVGSGSPVYDASALSGNSVQQLNDEINRQWGDLEQWDADVYNRQLKSISQSYHADLIGPDAKKSLDDHVNQQACDKTVSAMDSELRLANCHGATLEHNYNGLMTIIDHQPGIESLPNVAEVIDIYGVYRRIIAFNNRSFGLRCKFNASAGTWAPSWSRFAADVRTQRDRFLADNIYRTRLSHINDIKRINQTDEKLERSREAYYQSLYSQIERHFRSAANSANLSDDARQQLLSHLRDIKQKVYAETSGNGAINAKLNALYSSLNR